MPAERASDGAASPQRIDKWLWHARIVKTRTLATTLAGGGKVRLNGNRIAKASQPVKPGDVLTFTLNRRVRVLEILALAARRGPASEAQARYRDLSPADVPDQGPRGPVFNASTARREAGAGRPTKKQRRQIAAWTGQD